MIEVTQLIYTILFFAFGIIVPIVIFIIALCKRNECSKAAMFVMLGASLMLLATLGPAVFNFLGSRILSVENFSTLSMIAYLIGSIFNTGGVTCFVIAAFSNRQPPVRIRDFSIGSTQQVTSDPTNPYSTPSR